MASGSAAINPEYRAILRRDPCSYCGRKPKAWDPENRSESATSDHIDPHLGDMDLAEDEGNLTAACYRCNVQKGAKSVLDFLLWRIGNPSSTFYNTKSMQITREEACALWLKAHDEVDLNPALESALESSLQKIGPIAGRYA